MPYIKFLPLKSHEHFRVKSKFESLFVLDLFLHDWFFINLQMSTECDFTFLKTTIITFFLIYSLNIPNLLNHKDKFCMLTVIKICHFSSWRLSIWSYLRTLSLALMKIIKYMKFVCCFQTFNQNLIEYPKFTHYNGKANKKLIALAIHDWTFIVW